MSAPTRLCRICLTPEESVQFQPLLDTTKRFALDLFYVSQIKVIEVSAHVTALICSKCQIDLTSAARFKKISLMADSYFNKQLATHEEALYGVTVDDQQQPQQEQPQQQETEQEIVVESADIEVLDEYLDDIIEYDVEVASEPPTSSYILVPVEQEKSSPKITRKSNGTRNYACFCGKEFSSNHRLENHVKVRHTEMREEEKLTCLTCGKKFKIQEYLEIHIRNQHTDNPSRHRQDVSCSICGKILKSTVALKNHEDKHAADLMPEDDAKKFSCDLCGMKFRMKSYVFNHINNVHLRDKYPCEYCGKGFYKKYEKDEHVVRFHTNHRPIVCEYEGCEKTFARQKNYLIHKRIHTGERPFACEHCGKTFIHFIDKKRHEMRHTGERPYKCDKCDKGFLRRAELIAHERTHFV